MESVLVLIAAPGSGAIDARAIELLRDLGSEAPHWLAPGEAAEVPAFPRLAEFMIDAAKLPIDAAVVSIHNRRKRLLIADMDSTMIRQECIDELGVAAGLGDPIKAITARAMRGELDFAGALKERVALLKGLDAAVIGKIIRERITYMPGGRTLIATMKAHGAYTALVSGGFHQFTEKIASHLGFDENSANRLVIENGKLTGQVEEPFLGEVAKREAVRRIAAERGLDTADAIAVGDGANDVAMLIEAGMGVALHAKPHVQEASLIRINHGDLRALLYLQGYAKPQFVAV
jgi:phosphoserine phosphatase